MPKKILVSQRTQFWNLIRAGHSIKEASRRAGFSESYGKGLHRNGIGPDGMVSSQSVAQLAKDVDSEEASRPKRREELSPIALDCLEDFGRFRARYLGSVSMPWQEEAAHEVIRRLESPEDEYGVINSAQGGGKTRLFSHDIPAWESARDRTLRGILGSAGLGVSQSLTGNLKDTLSRTVPVGARDIMVKRGLACNAQATLAADYGRFKPVGAGNLWRREAFTVDQIDGEATQDKESTWAAFSYEAKFLSWRVDFMNWDDVHTSRQLSNQQGMDELFRWWDAEAESRLDPGGLCLVTMQRLGANDISRYLLDKLDPEFEIDADRPEQGPKQYFHVVFKAHYDDRCQGKHTREAPAYPEGCMLDPRRVTWAKIKAKKTAGIYEVVYQQEDVDPHSQLVRQAWVDGGLDPVDGTDHPGCWDDTRVAGDLPPYGPGSIRYITVDPSPTKWWAVQDWLYVPVPGSPELVGPRHLVDVERVRMGANELLDWSNDHQSWTGLLEDWVMRAQSQGFPVGTLIFEKNAAQRWAMQYEHFRRWQSARGVQVIPHETMGNKADPELGVEALIPAVYKHGRVRLPGKGVYSRTKSSFLVREVVQWPNGATDDQPMAQWMGEVHLPNLVGATNRVTSVYSDIPNWMRDAERRILAMR